MTGPTTVYLLIQTESGAPSEVLGAYTTQEKAEEARGPLNPTWSYEILPVVIDNDPLVR